MAIEVRIGSVLEAEAQTLVNTVNCVGIMGKGIALEFKKRYPAMFEEYKQRCASSDPRRKVTLGRPYRWKPRDGSAEPYIINFPTKQHWRSRSHVPDIEQGLRYMRRHYRRWGVESLAVPPLGCGNGGLRWEDIGPRLYRHFAAYPIPITLYVPPGTPPERCTAKFLLESGELEEIGHAQLALLERRDTYRLAHSPPPAHPGHRVS